MNLRGLTPSQVLASREKYGINQMPAPKLKTAWQFFMEVFQDKLNLILLFMMLIFIGLGISGYGSVSEAIGIGIVLMVVATTTVWTQLKTQRSAEQLRQKSSQMYANVIRDGIVQHMDS
ncbi:MAG: cation-transporting P-type ATPase, partial [Alphaproteobacteria bacterium]|nr:cation-transporting P-type ATPase [Alphaproteobacteria bacterium]